MTDSYTRIPSDVLEQLARWPFSKRQLVVLLTLARQTYGFNKSTDDITVSRLATLCQLDRSNVSRALEELVAMGAVSKRHGRFGFRLGINRKIGSWRPVPKQHTPVPNRHMCQNDTGACAKTTHTISNLPIKRLMVKSDHKPLSDKSEKKSSKARTAEQAVRTTYGLSGFARFWMAYPRKVGKQAAALAWHKNDCESIADAICAHVEARVTDDPVWVEAIAGGCKFMPHAATFINGRRFEDVYSSAPHSKSLAERLEESIR